MTVLSPSESADAAFVVIFGGSGDLARRKLLPALASLRRRGLLPAETVIVGVGRTQLDDEGFRSRQEISAEIAPRCFYCQADYTPEGARILRRRLEELSQQLGVPYNVLFYLSVPPDTFLPIVAALSEIGIARREETSPGWSRVVIEKPFGRDLASARNLNRDVLAHLDERQIYRIDHYLGKEGVQNLLVFRFANSIFEPIWNNRFIEDIQIVHGETLGLEGRGGYYDSTGQLRDMIQNHLMQLMCLTCMEPPASLDADDIRNEKVKVLKALAPLRVEGDAIDVVRGQYASGNINGQTVPAYRDESDVVETSMTETFAAMRVAIDNFRWAGVPVYLKSGKRLGKSGTFISVNFRQGARILFNRLAGQEPPRNRLVFRIQPQEGILLELGTKRPGQTVRIERTSMDFAWREAFDDSLPEAYERLLLDALRGDSTLFVRSDENELSWAFLQPVLDRWSASLQRGRISLYPAGSDGPEAAKDLLLRDGRTWVPIPEGGRR